MLTEIELKEYVIKHYSDDVKQMFDTFGIEIARNRLISEFTKAYGAAGSDVNSWGFFWVEEF